MILQASIYIVFAALLIVSALLLLVVLMQRPKQEGLGAAFGAQMTDQAFGAQTTDVLKKGTVLFGTLFMLLSFVLAVLMNAQYKQSRTNIAQDAATASSEKTAPQPVAPASAEAPTPAAPAETPAPATPAETPAPVAPAEAPAPAPAEAPAPAAPAEAPVPAEES